MLNWYKKLIALRRSNPALHEGAMTMLESGNPQILAWNRTAPNGKTIVVACNFAAEPQVVSLKDALSGSGTTAGILANSGGANGKTTVDLTAVSLPPYGSIIAEVK